LFIENSNLETLLDFYVDIFLFTIVIVKLKFHISGNQDFFLRVFTDITLK